MTLSAARRHQAAPDSSDLFHGATFMPDDDPARVDALIETVQRHRYSTFISLYMEAGKAVPSLTRDTGFADAVLDIMGSPPAARAALVGDPAFLAWLGNALIAVNRLLTVAPRERGLLRRRLRELSQVRARVDARSRDPRLVRVPGTPIVVQRFDIDPQIAAATPPSYKFPAGKARRRALERQGHSLPFFRDVVAVALERIRSTWPDDYAQITRLVKVIGYLPDASFRSCSASRYTGVIYLTAKDDSILDLEESLVHEAGHQLLYNIVEASPVSRDDRPRARQYTLPWSGQVRDFYGYFHAFYIYILLVKYFERAVDRPADEQQRVSARMVFILRGLIKALRDFEGNRQFTAHGRELFGNLAAEVRTFTRTHRRALARPSTPSTVRAVE
jgi:hypothetical protein